MTRLAIEYTDGKVVPVGLEDEMQRSYLHYAMFVNVDRALPDIRDGLKPVQRRILYGMSELGLRPDRPYRKSARAVGDVMAKYHPHGDAAIYDTMVRLAQNFSTRYPLVDGHGNWGSVDGDPAAAMRYTEARLAPIAMEMLRDLEKDTVDFIPNFDESTEQPEVLPSRYPNLLVNGSLGIGVAMATNIPPHNLREVIDALILMIDEPDVTLERIMQVIKGPDFPTAGLIVGHNGIRQAYSTGRGRIIMRARTQIEQLSGGRQRIVVTEIPYMVNKATLVERIAHLHNEKRVDGITALRDESDREGMRIVIELRRDANAHVVLNQLFKHSQLQETFGVIMLALVEGEPKLLNLHGMLSHYLDFQREVVTRRTRFELRKAEERAHILEGLRIALDNIDEIIALIRGAKSDADARKKLMTRFGLTERQAVAILDMQLRRLTGLEREKIEAEYAELQKTIAHLKSILADDNKLAQLIKEELEDVKERFGDARRTQITADEHDIDYEDLIAEEDIVVTLTHSGYVKRLPVDTYRAQRRGGRGITALNTKEEDFVEQLFITSTHTYIHFFTNLGRVYRLRGHEIPQAGRNARGTNIVNLIPIERDEFVQVVLPVSQYDEEHYVMMATKQGTVKKTPLIEYDSSRTTGIIGISLNEGDELIGVRMTDGNEAVVLVTSKGQAIRFSEEDVRAMGRQARGVRGIRLDEDDEVVAIDVARDDSELLVISEKGYGKRTSLKQYRTTGRGGKGVRTLRITEKNGLIVGARVVRDDEELMAISNQGVMIRMAVKDISRQGRASQGVTVMRLQEGDTIQAVAQLAAREEKEDD